MIKNLPVLVPFVELYVECPEDGCWCAATGLHGVRDGCVLYGLLNECNGSVNM